MQSFFQEIFKYQNEVNQDILKQFEKLEIDMPQKVVDLLSHSINAHKLWNYRIIENNEKVDFITHSIKELIVLDSNNFKDTVYICKEIDLNKQIDYNSMSGKAYHNSVQEILTQVSQHFQYHRGQMLSELLKHNINLKPTDYIYFRRKDS